jgi:hypothetical protein
MRTQVTIPKVFRATISVQFGGNEIVMEQVEVCGVDGVSTKPHQADIFSQLTHVARAAILYFNNNRPLSTTPSCTPHSVLLLFLVSTSIALIRLYLLYCLHVSCQT